MTVIKRGLFIALRASLPLSVIALVACAACGVWWPLIALGTAILWALRVALCAVTLFGLAVVACFAWTTCAWVWTGKWNP